MVGDTNTRTGTHMYMGEAWVSCDICMDGPYTYRLPVHVWGSPYVHGQNTCMGQNI